MNTAVPTRIDAEWDVTVEDYGSVSDTLRQWSDLVRDGEPRTSYQSTATVTLLPPKVAKHSRSWRVNGMTKRQWRRVRHRVVTYTISGVYLQSTRMRNESVQAEFSYAAVDQGAVR